MPESGAPIKAGILPAIQGHEFGGTIAEVGKAVSDLKVGDRVAVDPILPCHACVACHSGHINACRTLKLLGVDLAGGFGEYVAVPRGNIFALPDMVTHQIALKDVTRAFEQVVRDEPSTIKIVLSVQDS